jgi:hypothetical protein
MVLRTPSRRVRETAEGETKAWGATEGEPYIDVVGQGQARKRIDGIIARVEAGSNR